MSNGRCCLGRTVVPRRAEPLKLEPLIEVFDCLAVRHVLLQSLQDRPDLGPNLPPAPSTPPSSLVHPVEGPDEGPVEGVEFSFTCQATYKVRTRSAACSAAA